MEKKKIFISSKKEWKENKEKKQKSKEIEAKMQSQIKYCAKWLLTIFLFICPFMNFAQSEDAIHVDFNTIRTHIGCEYGQELNLQNPEWHSGFMTIDFESLTLTIEHIAANNRPVSVKYKIRDLYMNENTESIIIIFRYNKIDEWHDCLLIRDNDIIRCIKKGDKYDFHQFYIK